MYDVNPLIACCQALAVRCDGAVEEDGAGFNAGDSAFGKRVARLPAAAWDNQMAYAVYRMLRKYSGQLSAYGCSYDALLAPPKPSESDETIRSQAASQARRAERAARQDAERRPATMTIVGNTVVVNFGVHNWDHFSAMLAGTKALADRRFDGTTKNWIVKIQADTVSGILDLIRRLPFEVAEDFEEGLVTALQTRVEREAAAVEASRAAASDFVVNGLNPGVEPRPFQRAGVQYAVQTQRCLIADDMGLGKTIQALATFAHLQAFPALVVCPASVKINWGREAQKWVAGASIEVLNGKPGTYAADITIVNYDNLTKHVDALRARGLKAIAFDEFHYVKNPKAQRSKACEELAAGVGIRLGLTGTPVLNRPAEIINLLAILDRLDAAGGPGKLIYHYAGGYRDGYGVQYPKNPDPARLEELNARLRATCMIRRTKDQVLTELPEKARADIWLQLDNRAAYDRVERRTASAKGGAAEHLTRIGELRKLAAEGKLAAIKEWVADFLATGEKLVLFAHHVATQDALAAEFPGCAVVRGADDASTRQANVDRFQNEADCRLIVCSLKAAREGITLTAARSVAFAELGWHPGEMLQAEDRVHRIGQRNAVTAYYLLAADSIDVEMNDLINTKAVGVKALANGNKLTEEEYAALEASAVEGVLAGLRARQMRS